jgi:hypothetical protein
MNKKKCSRHFSCRPRAKRHFKGSKLKKKQQLTMKVKIYLEEIAANLEILVGGGVAG